MDQESRPKGKCYWIPDAWEPDNFAFGDGGEIDITEGVQALYDFVSSACGDSGSNFLSVEEAKPILVLAEACGFTDAGELREQMESQVHSYESSEFMNTQMPKGHVHFFGAWQGMKDGKPISRTCQWPKCYIVEDSNEYKAHMATILEYRQKLSGELPHKHVFSSVNRCMWSGCKEVPSDSYSTVH
jgi:hypothetical protein